MKVLLLIPLLFITLALTAGGPVSDAEMIKPERRIDSLEKILPRLRDSARMDALNSLAFAYVFTHPDSCLYYAEQALAGSRSLSYTHGMAVALAAKAAYTYDFVNNFIQQEALARESLHQYDLTSNKDGIGTTWYLLGFALFGQSQFDESRQYLEKAYSYATAKGDQNGMLAALSLISEAYRERGEYDSSFDIGSRCLQMASDAHSNEWVARQLFVLGNLSTHIEDYDAALSYFHRGFAMEQAKENNPWTFPQYFAMHHSGGASCWTLTEYAELLSLLGKYDSADYIYRHIDTTWGGPVMLRVYLVSTGEYYLLQKNYSHALANFQQSLIYNRQLNDINQVMRNLLDIARTYSASGKDKASLPYVREMLTMAGKVRARQYIRDGYQLLSSIYDREGRTDSAYSYYRRYIGMKDSVVSDQMRGKFAAYAFRQQINLLNKEKELNDVCLEHWTFVKNVIISGIFLILLIAFIYSRSILLKRKNAVENQLEIERLEAEKAKVSLQERTKELEIQALRSQMNPHFIFNCLNAINRFVLGHETEAASDYLTKFSRLMRMIMNHSRHSFISLSEELEVLSLYLDMESLRFKNAFDYKIQVDEDIDTGDVLVPPLLLQPFAENAVWHGLMHKDERGELIVSVKERNGVLTITIRDNGIGRKKASLLKSKSVEKYKSMGLQITAQRLALLTGEKEPGHLFEIKDLYDEEGNATGTQVTLKIQLHRQAGEPV